MKLASRDAAHTWAKSKEATQRALALFTLRLFLSARLEQFLGPRQIAFRTNASDLVAQAVRVALIRGIDDFVQ